MESFESENKSSTDLQFSHKNASGSKDEKYIQRHTSSARVKKKRKKLAHKKEVAIFSTYQEWLMCGEKLQNEITSYTSDSFRKNQPISGFLTDISEQVQGSQDKTLELIERLEKDASVSSELNGQVFRGEKTSPKQTSRIESLLFYSFLFAMIITIGYVFNGQNESGVPKNIGGYAPMTILTRSMQRVYPQNSLVIAKVTDPKTLKIGDDITYIRENNTTVTHRIVGINENDMGTGNRAFEAKGVENPRKDEEVIREENVIGKIVFSSPLLGHILVLVRENMILTAVTVVIFIIFSDVLIKYIKNNFWKKERK